MTAALIWTGFLLLACVIPASLNAEQSVGLRSRASGAVAWILGAAAVACWLAAIWWGVKP